MPQETPLSLEGLAAILERHIEHARGGFDRVERQIHDLTGQAEGLLGLMQEQGLRLTMLAEQQAEQQLQIRQILHRLEQHDARFEEHSRQIAEHSRQFNELSRQTNENSVFIRQVLDYLQRRHGNGGPNRT